MEQFVVIIAKLVMNIFCLSFVNLQICRDYSFILILMNYLERVSLLTLNEI